MAHEALEWDDALALHSVPDTSPISRRLFLKGAAAGVAVSAMPGWATRWAQAATPISADQGVLVVLYLGGGNDGINTVIPYQNPAYAGLRKSLAIPTSSVLDLGGTGGLGLHPSLTYLRSMWTQGRLAVVNGVGYPNQSLSHFDAQAIWAGGFASATATPGSGWLGRYLDGLTGPVDGFQGVSVSSSIPLIVRGASRTGSAFPSSLSGAFGASTSASEKRLYSGVRAFAGGPQTTGWGDQFALSEVSAMDMSVAISPSYTGLPGGAANGLALCAQLINANLGIRVLHTSLGGYDTHSGQAPDHANRLTELNNSVKAFFDRLAFPLRRQVTLMIYSEFGRRPEVNVSNGTDHGTAAPMLVMGDNIRGGLYGAYPSLTSLDRNKNLVAGIDFRSVYSTLLDGWLAADATSIIGAAYPHLGFIGAPPGQIAAPNIAGDGYWLCTSSGKVGAYGTASLFGDAPAGATISTMVARPQRDGYWLCSPNGKVYALGSAQHHGDMSTVSLAGGIVAMASTATGNGYWLVGSDGGIFSFGDAQFYGSTGNIHLNKPVVGMAATPTGKGYWMVAEDGGVFAYGDAQFYGSTGNIHLNKPVVGMAASPTGKGYWMVAEDGGVFAYGDAQFCGSTGDLRLAQPVISMVATPSGNGYWFVASDGGVFAFGDAQFKGAMAGTGAEVVGMGA